MPSLRRVRGVSGLSDQEVRAPPASTLQSSYSKLPQNQASSQLPQSQSQPYTPSTTPNYTPSMIRKPLPPITLTPAQVSPATPPQGRNTKFDGITELPDNLPVACQYLSPMHHIRQPMAHRGLLRVLQRQENGRSSWRRSYRICKMIKNHCMRNKRTRISTPENPITSDGKSERPLIRQEHFVIGEKTSDASQIVEAQFPKTPHLVYPGAAKEGENFPLRSNPIQIVLTPAPEDTVSTLPVTNIEEPQNRELLTIDVCWQTLATGERRLRSKLQRHMNRAVTDIRQIREENAQLKARCAELKLLYNVDRARATQQQLVAEGWERNCKVKDAEIENLQQQVLDLKSQLTTTKRSAILPYSGTDELDSEEPSIQTALAALLAAESDKDELFLPSPEQRQNGADTSQELIRLSLEATMAALCANSSISTDSEELFLPHTPPQRKSSPAPQELSATRSHEILGELAAESHPVGIMDDDLIEKHPTFLPQLEIRFSAFGSVFTTPITQIQEKVEVTISPSSATESTRAKHAGHVVSPISTLSDEHTSSPIAYSFHTPTKERKGRPEAAVFHFGERRVQRIMPAFRHAIQSNRGFASEAGAESMAASLRLDSWEWSSIPDLDMAFRM